MHKSPEERREYNKKYYAKHRDDLLEKKRKRYREDEEYRRKVNSRAVDRHRRHRLVVKRQKKKAEDPMMFQVSIDGSLVELKMYTLRQLSIALGKSMKTIRAWEDRGIMPKALYRSSHGPNGNRLYPEFQFTLILEAYAMSLNVDGRKRVERRISSTSFPERLREIWNKYPAGINPASI